MATAVLSLAQSSCCTWTRCGPRTMLLRSYLIRTARALNIQRQHHSRHTQIRQQPSSSSDDTTASSTTSSASSTMVKNPRVIALFDVDGTLTPARKDVSPEMVARLKKLREQITVGVVGGSDLVKQKEQLGETVTDDFDYSFSENGLVAYHKGVKVGETSLKNQFTNKQLNRFVNFVLRYIADLDIPIKRGTFLEFRMGMINVSPIGRNCSQEERDAFEQYDHVHHVRRTFVEALKKEFADYNLTFSIGGQISFDVFPTGWDKTFALRFLDPKDYDEIHFFGDKTHVGGNDHEIYTHERTIGHAVTSPQDTLRVLDELFPVTD